MGMWFGWRPTSAGFGGYGVSVEDGLGLRPTSTGFTSWWVEVMGGRWFGLRPA